MVRWGQFILITLLLSLLWLANSASVMAEGPASEENVKCLICHSNPDLAVEFADGSVISTYVSGSAYGASVHGQEAMTCGGCHPNHETYPHPNLATPDRRTFTLELNATCLDCHPDQAERVEDSNHARALAEGNTDAAVCVDCHGAHDTLSLREARVQIAAACRQCHSTIYDEYNQSVHSKALREENNTDVPTCVDCHGVHTMDDPHTVQFRLNSPSLCASCHADAELMSKYDISTEVFQTYVADFHGTTLELFPLKPGASPRQAVCFDCHGAHSIKGKDDPDSTIVKENLAKTCQKCHEDATANFPDAWIGHYEPSPTHTASVYYVEIFFVTLTASVLAVLEGHVILDFLRMLRDKFIRSSKE